MASPSSFTSRNYKFKVFSSFHGPDARKTILGHLRKQFDHNGITMFNDQEIVRSEEISPSLKKAIRESRISVVILTKNYASSGWCLDELVDILECKKTMGQTVMTIFYGVDPSDVRKQTGDFGIAFKETCASKTDNERQKWSKALNDVGNIAGEDFKNWDNEAKMIEKIARDVLDKLNATPPKDFDGMVGLEAHLREIQSLLDLDNDEAMMVGICGPAGIGKTTIARALQSLLSDKFQLTCFVNNLRGSYHSGFDDYGLKLHLQEQCLSKVLNQSGMRISHLGAIENNLSDQKVLIILDDVNHLKQLEALANEAKWFGPGSRIVITTEDQELLQRHGIDKTYYVGFPSDEEALKIFCRYAFKQSYPHDGFKELAKRITYLCDKLPLGLCVVGSSLRGKKDKDEWENVISRLKIILHQDIEDVLKVGYESLDEDAQTLFLHIAVFFNNNDCDLVKAMFADTDLDVKHLLNILEKKSLIEMSKHGEIIMVHRLLQQVGLKTIRKQKPLGPYQIIIDANDICDVLENNTGTRNVSGISLDTSRINEVFISKGAFNRMPNLRFLKVYKTRADGNDIMYIPEEMELPRRLRLLDWEAYPSKSLPPRFHPEYLIEINMQRSQLEKLWDGIQPLANLKNIYLERSSHLKELPDLSNATNLETLNLSHCESLLELPFYISNLRKLKYLSMFFCKKLEVIPTNWNLASLKWVDISNTSITTFDISVAAVKEVHVSVDTGNDGLHLSLHRTRKLKTLTQLPAHLSILNLRNSVVERISDCCIKGLPLLSQLILAGCRYLTSLPELPYLLNYLVATDCESLETLSCPLNTPNAELQFINCFKLDQQARKEIIQHQTRRHVVSCLPGSVMPEEFDHRAIGNITLTLPLSSFSSFKVCLVISPKLAGDIDEPKDLVFSRFLCRRISKGYLYPTHEIQYTPPASPCQTNHLFMFYHILSENERNGPDMVFEFSSKDFDIIECGVQIVAYETESDESNHQNTNEYGEASNEEGHKSESREASKDKDEEGIADGDYESVSRKRPRNTMTASASTDVKLGIQRRRF